jgi:hypothetical protein
MDPRVKPVDDEKWVVLVDDKDWVLRRGIAAARMTTGD